jgi:hypothetical protein
VLQQRAEGLVRFAQGVSRPWAATLVALEAQVGP